MGQARPDLTRGAATGPDVGVSVRILTDGKAGDEEPCLGLAEALGAGPDLRRVSPRLPFSVLAPWGPADGRDPALSGPLPDVVVASGRRTVPYLRSLRRRSGVRPFLVYLKDPRTGPDTADLIWVPAHDRLRGPTVLATVTAPHRISPARLATARGAPDPRVAALPRPRVAVLVGGTSRHHAFGADDVARLVGGLKTLADGGAALALTLSRRTPPALASALRELGPDRFLYEGEGPNPYLSMLALADAIVATADSTNMVGEAVATGVPVHVFEPSGGHPKISAFLAALSAHGAIRPFAGRLEAFSYEPLDCTPLLAEAVRTGLARHRRAALAGGPAPSTASPP